MKKIVLSISLMVAGLSALAQGTVDSKLASVMFPNCVISRDPSTLVGFSAFEGDPGRAWMSYMIYAPNSQVSTGDFSGGVNIAIKKATVGIEYSYIGSPQYEIIDELGMEAGTFKPAQTDLGLRFSYPITRNFGVKLRTRFMGAKYSEEVTVSNVCADINLEYRVGGLRAVAGVNSLGSNVDGSRMPTSAIVAAQYAAVRAGDLTVDVSAQGEYYLYGAFRAAAMAQGQYRFLLGRIGINYGGAQSVLPTYFTAGLGAALGKIQLDASAIFGGELSGTMLFGVSYKF